MSYVVERVVILDARSRQMPPEWAAGDQSNNLGEIAALTLAQEMLPPNVAADLYTDSSVARTAWIKTTTPKENVDLSIRKCVRQEWGVSKHAMGVMQELGEEILAAGKALAARQSSTLEASRARNAQYVKWRWPTERAPFDERDTHRRVHKVASHQEEDVRKEIGKLDRDAKRKRSEEQQAAARKKEAGKASTVGTMEDAAEAPRTGTSDSAKDGGASAPAAAAAAVAGKEKKKSKRERVLAALKEKAKPCYAIVHGNEVADKICGSLLGSQAHPPSDPPRMLYAPQLRFQIVVDGRSIDRDVTTAVRGLLYDERLRRCAGGVAAGGVVARAMSEIVVPPTSVGQVAALFRLVQGTAAAHYARLLRGVRVGANLESPTYKEVVYRNRDIPYTQEEQEKWTQDALQEAPDDAAAAAVT